MVPPANLSASQQDSLKALTQTVLNMFEDCITSIVHFEAKIHGDVCVPIELNLRLGGAETYHMVKAAYEVQPACFLLSIRSLLACLLFYSSLCWG